MPETQQEFELSTTPPAASAEEVAALADALKGRGWVFAKDLKSELGVSDRALRAAAAESDGAIISGQKGYRLLDGSVPLEEVDHAAGWLESQGKQMIKRASAIRRRYHRYARA